MIKLISKRRLAFRNPEDGTFVTVLPHVFETVPDWASKDPIFRWGIEDGTIQTADAPIVKAPEKAAEAPKTVEKELVEEKAAEPKKTAKKGRK